MASVPENGPPGARVQWGRKQLWLFGFLFISAWFLGLLNLFVWVEQRSLPKGSDLEAPEALSFDGSSEDLKETIVVPTLDRPVPEGRSALWCATFPMAWQELTKRAPIQPVEVEGAEEICRELNGAPRAELEPEHYYAAGGFIADGILERIKADVARRFPHAKLPDSSKRYDEDTAIGYACLEVAMHFETMFTHSWEPLQFKDSEGRLTPVHAFGIRERDKEQRLEARHQVLVLFRENGQFAVDLSRSTKPYQIILARVDRGPTLQATLDQVDARIAASTPLHLNEVAVLLVPSMNWRVSHRFRELEKRVINHPNPKAKVVEAYQAMQFKMDRKGARVASSARGLGADWSNGHPNEPDPKYYLFDQPFLLLMKRRGRAQPFFVMWVDNAELLQRR